MMMFYKMLVCSAVRVCVCACVRVCVCVCVCVCVVRSLVLLLFSLRLDESVTADFSTVSLNEM